MYRSLSSIRFLGTGSLLAFAWLCAGADVAAQSRVAASCADQSRRASATFGDLLQGEVPGVNVLQHGGASGGAKRIRIRGVNSIRAKNPIVFVDGVRVSALEATGLRGLHSIPLLEFVDPIDIVTVEVLRGPTASLQYGDASDGVILISTKRGGGEAGVVAKSPPACAMSTARKP